jgi:hypothetical protein
MGEVLTGGFTVIRRVARVGFITHPPLLTLVTTTLKSIVAGEIMYENDPDASKVIVSGLPFTVKITVPPDGPFEKFIVAVSEWQIGDAAAIFTVNGLLTISHWQVIVLNEVVS